MTIAPLSGPHTILMMTTIVAMQQSKKTLEPKTCHAIGSLVLPRRPMSWQDLFLKATIGHLKRPIVILNRDRRGLQQSEVTQTRINKPQRCHRQTRHRCKAASRPRHCGLDIYSLRRPSPIRGASRSNGPSATITTTPSSNRPVDGIHKRTD